MTRPRNGPNVYLRYPTRTRGTQADYFLPRDEAENYGHFGTGTTFQNPRSYQNMCYPA